MGFVDRIKASETTSLSKSTATMAKSDFCQASSKY